MKGGMDKGVIDMCGVYMNSVIIIHTRKIDTELTHKRRSLLLHKIKIYKPWYVP